MGASPIHWVSFLGYHFNFSFGTWVVECGQANVAWSKLFSPSFLSMLYSLAMFFCFFSKFRFIRKKVRCRSERENVSTPPALHSLKLKLNMTWGTPMHITTKGVPQRTQQVTRIAACAWGKSHALTRVALRREECVLTWRMHNSATLTMGQEVRST